MPGTANGLSARALPVAEKARVLSVPRSTIDAGVRAKERVGHRKRKQVDPSTVPSFFALKNLTTEVVRNIICWHYLFSQAVTRQVSSAQMCLTSVFGMGTGGPS